MVVEHVCPLTWYKFLIPILAVIQVDVLPRRVIQNERLPLSEAKQKRCGCTLD